VLYRAEWITSNKSLQELRCRIFSCQSPFLRNHHLSILLASCTRPLILTKMCSFPLLYSHHGGGQPLLVVNASPRALVEGPSVGK
jgi:hypothetical protein